MFAVLGTKCLKIVRVVQSKIAWQVETRSTASTTSLVTFAVVLWGNVTSAHIDR